MDYYWLTARSITHAQRMQKALAACGLSAQLRRTSAEMAQKGCGYMLRIAAPVMGEARMCLGKSGIAPVKVFQLQNGAYLEVNYDLF